MLLPDDDNAEALRRLVAEGDDLSQSRDVDFTIVFPDQPSAEGFALHLAELGYKVSVAFTECKHECPWDVVVTKPMAPSYAAIVEFETVLQRAAETWGGENAGSGCFSQRTKH